MSNFFRYIYLFGLLAFIAGMIKPAWIMRRSTNPTRRQIAIVGIPILFLIGGIIQRTKTPEEIASDAAIEKQKVADKWAADAPKREEEASREGVNLYNYYKSVSGNEDRPGYNEQQYVRGQILSQCNVNGKPRGYYGWIEFRTIFLEGSRIKNDPVSRMYVFAVASGDDASVIWRGEEYKQAVIDSMHQTCD
jgi:hypothetical protein